MNKGANDVMKIIQGVTSYLTVVFIRDQVEFIRENGYDVEVLCNKDFDSPHEGLEVTHIPFEREISIVKDLSALYKLMGHLKKKKPDLINFSTPKAGLLGMIAGAMSGVDKRIYMIRGLRLETATGFKKIVLYLTEKLSCTFSTHIMVISDSMEREVIRLKIANPDKIVRIGRGSSNGIDLDKFNPENIDAKRLRSLKDELKVKDDDLIIGYAGRLTKDKGINELIEAFESLSFDHERIKLLLIGDFEEGDPLEPENVRKVYECENIIYRPYTAGLDYYYSLMGLFALPTYREGFSNVSIEAQSMGVPVVTFDSTGASDTVEDGVTGLVTTSNDVQGLVEALNYLITHEEKRTEMSKVSRKFVADNFDRRMMQQQLLEFYDRMGEQGDENAEKTQDYQGT